MKLTDIIHGVFGITKSTLGIDKADEKLVITRLSICKGCEYLKYKEINGKIYSVKCGHCGCYLKHKLKLSTENCPVGKW